MGKYQEGLVSVIIPTYKRSDKLIRAVNSVLNQTYNNLEVFIVNDNDPNDEFTKLVVKQLENIKDSRVNYIEQEKHINGAVARNIGIKNSRGEYICFLDDDDYWMPTKLETQIRIMNKLDPTWGVTSTLVRYYNEEDLYMATLPYKSGYIMKEIMNRHIGLSTCTVMIRHEALDKVGYFDEQLNRHQEIQLFSFLAQEYKIKLIKEHLTCVETSDSQNRPDLEKLKLIKKDFFRSVRPLIDTLTKKEKKDFYLMHDFELAYAFIKSKRFVEGFKYASSILKSTKVLVYSIDRVIKRITAKRFKNIILKIYN